MHDRKENAETIFGKFNFMSIMDILIKHSYSCKAF